MADEQQADNLWPWIPALVLAIVVMVVVAIIAHAHTSELRDLQRRIAVLESK